MFRTCIIRGLKFWRLQVNAGLRLSGLESSEKDESFITFRQTLQLQSSELMTLEVGRSGRENFCLSSPAKSFLVPGLAGLITLFPFVSGLFESCNNPRLREGKVETLILLSV
jgi:hypothetical protein